MEPAAWSGFLAFPLASCVNLGEFLDFSEPWVPHLEMRVRLVPTHRITVIRLVIEYFDKRLAHGKCPVYAGRYCLELYI